MVRGGCFCCLGRGQGCKAGTCENRKDTPLNMICEDCVAACPQGKVPSNVLTCALPRHRKIVQAQLIQFAEDWIPNLSIRRLGVQLSVNFSCADSYVTEYRPPQNPDEPSLVFDTFTGESRPRTEKDKIVTPSSETAFYVMQTLNICNKPCLTFYDSGANTHLVQARLAEEAGFLLLSRNSIVFRVAGGRGSDE
jgi:hypothetical protein